MSRRPNGQISRQIFRWQSSRLDSVRRSRCRASFPVSPPPTLNRFREIFKLEKSEPPPPGRWPNRLSDPAQEGVRSQPRSGARLILSAGLDSRSDTEPAAGIYKANLPPSNYSENSNSVRDVLQLRKISAGLAFAKLHGKNGISQISEPHSDAAPRLNYGD